MDFQIYLFLSIPILTLSNGATIDCITACDKCEENLEPRELLEVNCAMCNECKERWQRVPRYWERPRYWDDDGVEDWAPPRRKWRDEYRPPRVGRRRTHSFRKLNEDEVKEWPAHCPTPEPCEYEEDSASTTTSARPPATCPSITPCKRPTTRQMQYMPCMPCMPPCPCPMYYPPYMNNPPYMSNPPYINYPPSVATTTEAYYVYVGIPKDAQNNK